MDASEPIRIDVFPNEILVRIFSYLPAGDLFRSAWVCRRWRELIYEFYLSSENQKNWRGVAEIFIESHKLEEYLKSAPRLGDVFPDSGENPESQEIDYKELVQEVLHRRSLLAPEFDAKRICYNYSEDSTSFTVVKISGDVVILYSPKHELLTLNTVDGEVLRSVREASVRCVELAAVNSENVMLERCRGTARHDHVFILTENGLIKLVELSKLQTLGVITYYHGLHLKSICYDSGCLYVYDGHYGISAYSVPDLQRTKRFSVDGLNSYHVANHVLVYIEDSGKYHNPKMEVGFSYNLLPFSINMVNYVTPLVNGEKMELPDFFESKIFRIDCILFSLPNYVHYLTMDGENYRRIEFLTLPGNASCVSVNGPTLVIGTTLGKLLVYHVPNSKSLMACDFDKPDSVFHALKDKPIWAIEVFDTREAFGIFASDCTEICTYVFPRI